MFKKKKEKAVEREEIKLTKMLFSEIPLGSILFDYQRFENHNFQVLTQLGDFEQPTYTIVHSAPMFVLNFDREINYEAREEIIGHFRYVSYDDLIRFGFDSCIGLEKYTIIDLEYVRKVKAVRELKTVKELKDFVEKEIL